VGEEALARFVGALAGLRRRYLDLLQPRRYADAPPLYWHGAPHGARHIQLSVQSGSSAWKWEYHHGGGSSWDMLHHGFEARCGGQPGTWKAWEAQANHQAGLGPFPWQAVRTLLRCRLAAGLGGQPRRQLRV